MEKQKWRFVAVALMVMLVTTAPFSALAAAADNNGLTDGIGTKYHSYAELTSILEHYAENYKELAKLSSIGKSYLGKDLWMMEITNTKTGPAADKPAIYVDGNTHGTEITGGEAALYSIKYLLENYGKDPQVTRLLDTRTFYIVPWVNPDGADLHVTTPRGVSTNLRPADNDGDGYKGEDPPQDINGDGEITQMRIEHPDGNRVHWEEDNRLMRSRRDDDEGPFYFVYTEGLDLDGDGRYGEDGLGGAVNLNRNYPANWQPNSVQRQSGAFPFSEPETRAIGEFFANHPNISAAQSYHTWAGVILRPYAFAPDDELPEEDLALYKQIGQEGTDLIGYRNASTYHEFPGDGVKRYGTFVDWAYHTMGLLSFTIELWHAPGNENVEWFSMEEDKGALDFFDREYPAGFVEWAPFDHPQLGSVEIGGFAKLGNQNPPEGKWLQETVEKGNAFILLLAEYTPLVQIEGMEFSQKDDPGLYDLTVKIRNVGGVSTDLTQRRVDNMLARPITATARFTDSTASVEGRSTVSLGAIGAGEVVSYTWTVRMDSIDNVHAAVVVEAEKGGMTSKTLRLEQGVTANAA